MAETRRQRYWRQVREIRNEEDVSHAEARRRWRDHYQSGGRRARPARRIELTIRASISDTGHCPFCRDSVLSVEEGGPDFTCPACQAHYHRDCFEDELGGRCATLGCSTRRVISRARGREIRAITPETPVTRAREGATVQELDPEDYRRAQEAREMEAREAIADAEEAAQESLRASEEWERGVRRNRERSTWARIWNFAFSFWGITSFLFILAMLLSLFTVMAGLQ